MGQKCTWSLGLMTSLIWSRECEAVMWDEHSTCGIWCYLLWLDGVSIELNCRTPSLCWRTASFYGESPWHTHTVGIGALVAESLSCVQVFANSWTAIREALLSPTVSQSLLRFISIELVTLSSHFILCCSFHLLPSVFSSIRVFSSELALCIRWPKYWSFSFRPSNEYSGLISFRIDLFDLLAAQGTLESLHHHHTLEASVLQHLAFFTVQLLTSVHDY